MKSTVLAAGVLTLALTGCQTAAEKPKMGWARIDGRPVLGNPKLEQQAEIDKTVCLGETSKAAANMQPVYYRGIAGAIQADMIGQQRTEMLTNVAKGCMAEKGYILITEEEAQARRAAAAAKRN